MMADGFLFHRSGVPQHLHSFPTRRSSDLGFNALSVITTAVPVTWTLTPGQLSVHPTDRKSTRLNSSHVAISYAVFCLKKKTIIILPGSTVPPCSSASHPLLAI